VTKLIITPLDRARREELYDLLAKVFRGRGYPDFRDACRNGLIDHGPYDWNSSRVGQIDGRLVTHWGVYDMPMRIGSAVVRVAGIGNVATHADYRNRGYMSATARASIAAMRSAGYDLSLLFGINDFYHRFGYIRAWATRTWRVRLAELPKKLPRVRLRKLSLRRCTEWSAPANRYYAGLTGTMVRPTYVRGRFAGDWQAHGWRDGRGRLIGYVVAWVHDNALDVVDAVGRSEQVLAALAALTRKAGQNEMRIFDLHPLCPLGKYLRRHSCRIETLYRPNGGAMMRIINLRAALDKLTGELSRRLKASALRAWRGTLVLGDGRESVNLTIRRGRVRVGGATRSRHAVRGRHLGRLLLGADEPGEIIEAGRMKVTGDARWLVEALFPHQHPAVPAWDHF